MIIFYIILYNFFNVLYLLFLLLIIILSIEIYALSFIKYRISFLMVIPLISLTAISVLFYYVGIKSLIYIILASFFYIYLILLEIGLSNPPNDNLDIEKCCICNYKIKYLRNL